MIMISVIDKANKEYAANGRSKAFVALEDKIIASQKMTQIYLFARYVKGADIDKLQDVILQNGKMEDCFYFLRYVKGSNIKLFLQKALDEKNEFWVKRLVVLTMPPFNVHSVRELEEFEKQLKDEYKIELKYDANVCASGVSKADIDGIIKTAQAEYKKYGHSQKFEELTREALYAADADVCLFAKHVLGKILADIQTDPKKSKTEIKALETDLKKFQTGIILRGNAHEAYIFSQLVPQSNPKLLLDCVSLAERDYMAIDKFEGERIGKLTKLEIQRQEAADNRKKANVSQIKRRISQELRTNYMNEVLNYKRRLEYLADVSDFGRK